MPRARYVLIITATLLAIFSVSAWASARWRRASVAVAVPIAPARAIHVNMWTPGLDYLPSDWDHSIQHTFDGPLTVMIWYQHHGAATIQQLGVFRLPSWPLLVMGGSMGLLAVWLWSRRGHPIRERSTGL